MELTYQNSVGEVVANDFRTAAIFEKYGIDFCCKGHRSIDEACERKSILTEEVMRELKKHFSSDNTDCPDYKSWSSSQLVDYILEKHHGYIAETTPLILRYLDKLCKVHGEKHPELFEVNRLFSESAEELAQHMKKEELFLFPWIKGMDSTSDDSAKNILSDKMMVKQPVSMLMHEHETEGDRYKAIETLTNQYQVPSDGCSTYMVAYQMLREFQNDLHLHIHLENNILFPKAIELEGKLEVSC
jgi:regulator of cell morphogenesis and NO signaling